MTPLNILHVFRAPVGGLFRHVLDLAREQVARGHHVGLIADSNTGGPRGEATLKELAPSLAFGVSRIPMRRHIGPGDAVAMTRVMARIAQAARTSCTGMARKVAPMLAWRSTRAVRSVRTRRTVAACCSGHDTLAGKFYLATEKLLMLRGDLFLFESAYSAEIFRRKIGNTAWARTRRPQRCVAKGI